MIESKKVRNYYQQKVIYNDNNLEGFLRQVGKTFLGEVIHEDIFKKIIKSIEVNLDLSKNDNIIDMGCANGLLTASIANSVNHIYGYDLSNDLITVAKDFHQRPNISYFVGDLLEINYKEYKVEKFYMYEALQHFEYNMLRKLLNKLIIELDNFKLYIGSVPDRELILNFYDTDERRRFLFNTLLEDDKIHLGNWWFQEHIMSLCKELQLKVAIIEQDKELHTSHYRFDVLIEKR